MSKLFFKQERVRLEYYRQFVRRLQHNQIDADNPFYSAISIFPNRLTINDRVAIRLIESNNIVLGTIVGSDLTKPDINRNILAKYYHKKRLRDQQLSAKQITYQDIQSDLKLEQQIYDMKHTNTAIVELTYKVKLDQYLIDKKENNKNKSPYTKHEIKMLKNAAIIQVLDCNIMSDRNLLNDIQSYNDIKHVNNVLDLYHDIEEEKIVEKHSNLSQLEIPP